MASRLRENQAGLARLQRTIETLEGEANQPFISSETKEILSSAITVLRTKVIWLESQIESEKSSQGVPLVA
jgi:hypothetical protein